MKVVIIGGVAGGASAAARLRRLDESAEIVVFEKSGFISYANCGLPYYVGDVITNPAELTLQTPESFWGRFHVKMKVHHEVTAIDSEKKTVQVHDLDGGRFFEENYDKLIIATGAKPICPDLPGIQDEKIFTLRTVEDAYRIRGYVDEARPKTALVVGGGFIGIEIAENLHQRGISVTLVEKEDQLMRPFDSDMASFIHSRFRSENVELILGCGVTGFGRERESICTSLEDDRLLHSDMVVLTIGVTPDTGLARGAGLKLGHRGSIVVNEYMESSIPNIYAVGDAVQVKNYITGSDALISLAGPANKQGRIAADNICGYPSAYPGAQGNSIIKVFDMTAAFTGLNEREAKAAGLDYDKVVLSPSSHAGYYPGAKLMTIKVLFQKESLKLLGAQIIGYEGVDKRMDVLSTAIFAGLSAVQLKHLDLAYAPPYSSAKDPVNLVGFMVENLVSRKVGQIHVEQLAQLPTDGSVVLLDVRTPAEYARGHAAGFVNIPLDQLRERMGEISAGKPVYVMCQSALRSYIACRILSQNGFVCYNFSGGYRFYASVMQEQVAKNSAYPCGVER